MRKVMAAVAAVAMLAGASQAIAAVSIVIDKDIQEMRVSVDGVEKYRWPVSSGLPNYETPNGSYTAFRMEEDHYSKEFDDAPMPHSIFFTKQGHAIHGTDAANKLGSPASHGCVRLSRANAATLYDLVKREGLLTTKVALTGSSQVALARNPRPARGSTAVARSQPQQIAPQVEYDASGQPLRAPQDLTPRRLYPEQRQEAQVDPDYYYSTDPDDQRRYPAPRGYRRSYEAQSNLPDNQYRSPQMYAPQVYAPQPYYGPRGYYENRW